MNLSHAIYRLKFAVIIETNSKTANYALMGDKRLQDVGRELHAAAIPAVRRNNRQWILVLLKVFGAGYTEINNQSLHAMALI